MSDSQSRPQANDLVSRLTLAAQGEGASDFTPATPFTLLLEARDELDRLRAVIREVAERDYATPNGLYSMPGNIDWMKHDLLAALEQNRG